MSGLVDTREGFHAGWPGFIAHPMSWTATPGSMIKLEAKILTNALIPLAFQWSREHLYTVTNIVFIQDTNGVTSGTYSTNRISAFITTLLTGETNATFLIQNAQPTNSDYYSVQVSNSVGVTTSQRANIIVAPSASIQATNDYWLTIRCRNNLRQLQFLSEMWPSDGVDLSITNLNQIFLLEQQFYDWPQVLFCPADPHRPLRSSWNEVDFTDTSYLVLPRVITEEDQEAPVFQCKFHFYDSSSGGPGFIATNSPLVVRPLDPQTRLFGSNFTLKATAIGPKPIFYQWSKDGNSLVAETNANLNLSSLVRTNSGIYSVSVWNFVTNQQSILIPLTVQVPQRLFDLKIFSTGLQMTSGFQDGEPVLAGELDHYKTQFSTNLIDWVTESNALTLSNGFLFFHKNSPSTFPNGFYRVVEN